VNESQAAAAGKGRPKGATNKATREIKEIAQPYGPEAIATLAEIMRHSESEPARVAAANALLDRGYGKPSQTVAVDQTLTVVDDRAETEAYIRELSAQPVTVSRH
jgi:hypothetical protein